MKQRIVLMAVLALVPLTLVPAWAVTESSACVAAIKAANVHHRAATIPADCWRIGPLTLGMTRAAAQSALGGPDASRNTVAVYRRQKIVMTETLYVYPRNLKNWLRLAPQPVAEFHPVTLHLLYRKDALVAMTVDDTGRTDGGRCTPTVAAPPFARGGADFPYNFHGIALGSPLTMVAGRFGHFADRNAPGDFKNYWPVPLAFGGDARVGQIAIAAGMAFTGIAWIPEFQARLDPRTCFVTDFQILPAH